MSKIRLIQCGVGGMGVAWWKNATGNSPDVELAAIVDVVDKPLTEAGEALGIPADRRFKTLEEAIKSVPADAVLTVTPPAVHVEHAKIAFSNGLHLLTEKPIGPDLAGAKLMVGLAERAGKQLVVAQNYRYSAPIQKLIAIARDNDLGEFGHGHIDFYIPADFTGSFREAMEYVLLVDMSIHHLDLIRAVTGRNIVSTIAQTFRPSWSWYKHHCGLKMLLELDGGIPFSYSGNWSAKGKCTGWNGNWRLQFAEGSIHLDNDKLTVARCDKWSKNEAVTEIEVPPIPFNGQQAILARFVEAIRTGKPAETDGKDNLWSFRAVMASVKSSEETRKVSVAEMLT